MTKKIGLNLFGWLLSLMSFQCPASAHERPITETADHETVMITPKVSFINNPQTRRHPAQISGTESKVTRTGASISTYTEGTPYGYTNVIAVMPPKGSGRANMIERTPPFPSARAAEQARKTRVQQLISENGGV